MTFKVSERHIGPATIDPAAQTELMLFCKELGFEVIDSEEGQKVKADVIISGEGLSTFASRRGNLILLAQTMSFSYPGSPRKPQSPPRSPLEEGRKKCAYTSMRRQRPPAKRNSRKAPRA